MLAWILVFLGLEFLLLLAPLVLYSLGFHKADRGLYRQRMKVRLGAYALILLSPAVFAYPAMLDDRVTAPVVVFEGGKVVEKKWGTWHWPWDSDKEWTRFVRCKPVGHSRGSEYAIGETAIALLESGELRVERSWPQLCIYNPELFFADRSRRRVDSPEAAAAWATADYLALDALYSPEMIGLRRLYIEDLLVAERHSARVRQLNEMGFTLVIKSKNY